MRHFVTDLKYPNDTSHKSKTTSLVGKKVCLRKPFFEVQLSYYMLLSCFYMLDQHQRLYRKQTNNIICTLPQFTIIFFEPIYGQCVMSETLTLSFQHILPPFHISPSDRCTNIVFAAMHRGRQSYSNCSNQSPAFHTLQISIGQSVGRVLMLA